jgi:hypothetical protein
MWITAPSRRTDESGTDLGEFKAGEYVFQVGGGIPVDSLFSVGANVKFITSNLDTWNSTAWAVDLGGVFHKRELGHHRGGIGAQPGLPDQHLHN